MRCNYRRKEGSRELGSVSCMKDSFQMVIMERDKPARAIDREGCAQAGLQESACFDLVLARRIVFRHH